MAQHTYFPDLTHLSEQEILKARENLVQAEHDHNIYKDVKQTALEKKAGEIVTKIKNWEELSLHKVHNDGSGWEAGHKFFHGLPNLHQSKLMAIASKAPKACLLHCHFDTMLPPELLLNFALKQNNLFIRSDVPLTSEGLFMHALPLFAVLSKKNTPEPSEATNLFSKGYIAGSYMQLSKFLEAFPGGSERGQQWIRQKMFLGPDLAYSAQQTVNG
jgi:adenosine deaminase CECR1